jgi:hypothetical protein
MKRIYVALGLAFAFFACVFAYTGAARAGCNYTVSNGTCSNTVSGTNDSTIAGGADNTTNGNYSTVSGGAFNRANSQESTIAGGYDNLIETSSDGSTICGGYVNEIDTSLYATIAGGYTNSISSSSDYSTIGGGYENSVSTETTYSVIAGGDSNNIATECDWGTIGGGDGNVISDLATYATIGGGYANRAQGEYSTVPGGESNTAAGQASFAAGQSANANKDNCFVWSDGSATRTCSISGTDTAKAFVVQATGGVEFISATGPDVGVVLSASSNGFAPASDRRLKREIQEVDPREFLKRVASMPIATWRFDFKEGMNSPLHVGPMAQDFYATFNFGDDDTHISTMDEVGVALAAIQGLDYESLQKDELIDALGTRVAVLERANVEANDRAVAMEQANVEANRRVASLEKRLEQIEALLELRK